MMFLENSFTFNNTQVIVLSVTIGMELKELCSGSELEMS